MNRESLLAAGFREHPSNHSALQRWDVLYQKRIRDEHGTRYFVDVMLWRLSKYDGGRDGWEVEINYNDGCAFHPFAAMLIKLYAFREEWTPEMVLAAADDLRTRLAPNYYERED